MASEVDICNLALGYIGQAANITSLAERSVEAQLCAKFYPIARKTLLEMATWSFSTRRVKLAQVANPTLAIAQGVDANATQGTWQYAYALPNNVINAISVLPAEAIDDYEAMLGPFGGWQENCAPYPQGYLPVPGAPVYVPQPYVIETQADGSQIILTNCIDAVLRYTVDVTDTSKFGPLFTMALGYLVSSMLAGPIIKGQEGAAMSIKQLAIFKDWEGQAEASDANQRKVRVEPSPDWIRGR
jgi:hypothetical protein